MFEPAEYLKLAIALIAIVDIPGNIPVFLQQTEAMSPGHRRLTAVVAGVATGLVLVVFAIAGEWMLSMFGITIAAFKVLGGIVILVIALDMLGLLGGDSAADSEIHRDNSPYSVGVFPMAVPLFAGPGAIAAVMVYGHEEFHSQHDLIVVLVILTTACAVAFGMLLASFLNRFIGETAHKVMNRLLGIVVGALGIEFVLEGLGSFYPGLGG